jgi:hypothetical protein
MFNQIFDNNQYQNLVKPITVVMDINASVFEKTVEEFNKFVGKEFHTYTLKAVEMYKTGSDNAKKFITTGTIPEVYGHSFKK